MDNSPTFLSSVPFADRCLKAQQLLAMDKIPVVCEAHHRSDLPRLQKRLLGLPGNQLLGEFKFILYRNLNCTLEHDQTIYVFVLNIDGNTQNGIHPGVQITHLAPMTSIQIEDLYHQYKADDNFLHIRYSAENVLGGCEQVKADCRQDMLQ
eukprot:TRINITY_DN53026_c0_g3_i1.p1 TRINITY_DN53026_c0_g3~~TRINITY_DN53026_c0_g3_i1.p1  ORF type:complete len:151 (+),score=19.31 TRINITY_DN53026_c0_g3_i1:144-596(+)